MSAAASGYENSSSFFQGFADAMRDVGLFERLRAALPPEQFAPLENPRQNRWWPGGVLAGMVGVIERETDAATIEKLAYLAVKKAVAPVAMPLIKVTIAISGSSPETILSRATTFGATALRGVDLQWKRTDASSGVLVCTYPEAVPAQYDALWRGTLQFVFELTKVTGTFGAVTRDRHGAVLNLPLSWK